MNESIYLKYFKKDKKGFGLLIDPEFQDMDGVVNTLRVVNTCDIDFILVGGSLVSMKIDELIEVIQQHTKLPVILFPGNLLQISDKADAILLMSLISGRNSEYLIGNHVSAAPFIKKAGLEVIPTGYILIDSGRYTSVHYMSNTLPIPSNKSDLVVATALAGEQMGMKLIYLEGGSGADIPVPLKVISDVKKAIEIPLMVGGGIETVDQLLDIYKAGADFVIIGTAVEKNLNVISEFAAAKRN